MNPPEKIGLHPRNLHRNGYDFAQLLVQNPALSSFVQTNPRNEQTIDFTNPAAVKALNKALINTYYGVALWDIPANYLCPPVPSRADYVHYIADILAAENNGEIPRGKAVRVLDIGVGANCIYPIIGAKSYGWTFVGSDIDPVSVRVAAQMAKSNPNLKNHISIRLQPNANDIFVGMLQEISTRNPETGLKYNLEKFDACMCNPPFHTSIAQANEGTARKLKNLGQAVNAQQPTQNFGGQSNELACDGGEASFIWRMITESAKIPTVCRWFTTLVANKEHLPNIYKALEKANATEVRTIPMQQGQKQSRIVAWTFQKK
jgi:23S rRNA (adenine1618-N6)-methyltransferase